MTLERGFLLHKRYRIEEILGQGGMGSVYRAVDENLGVDVAVKENLFTTDEYARQFRLEAVILANLRHPNLPRVSDHFVIGEEGQYLVMDFIEGEDLRQRMEREGTISDEDAIQIGAAMCDALLYLHTRKPSILHRDIKPGNVKITPDGHIYLVDFGLAKVMQGSQVTTTGARAMTPGYSPPEQYGTARTDPRTDIYSLGATLYAALCGTIPEDGLARAMDNAELTPLRKRNPKIVRRLAAAIEKAMAVDPAERFQTAEEFKKALLNSKSKTQQLTGNYTVTPPPAGFQDAQRELNGAEGLSDPKKPSKPISPAAPAVVEEEKPFIPPGRRKKEQRKRSQRAWILFLLVILAGMVSAVYIKPSLLPADVRGIISFLPTTPTLTPSPQPTATLTETPAPTATEIPPTATFTLTMTARPIATSTLVAVATIRPTIQATATTTPRGGGYGQIAFASDRSGLPQIYLSDLKGEIVVPVTSMADGACQPSWSPDGTKLVFVSPCRGPNIIGQTPLKNTSLYIISADGSQLTSLTTVPGGDFEPAWSPDGTHIAFTSLRDGDMQVYALNLADQTVARLTDLGPGVEARQPAWSPSGDRLVFVALRVGTYQIWTMSAAGEDPRQVVRSGQEYWDYFPVWSKDGKAVVFSQRSATAGYSPPWQMSVIYENRNNLVATKLNLGPLPVEHVVFSADGFWLAIQGQAVEGNTDIFYMTVTGGERTRLTSDPGQDFDPAWRPIAGP